MKKTLLTLAISICGTAMASTAHAQWVYGGKGKITSMLPAGNFNVIKMSIPTVANPAGCERSEQKFGYNIVTIEDHPLALRGADEAMTLLMGTLISNGELEFQIYVSNEGCYGKTPVIRIMRAVL